MHAYDRERYESALGDYAAASGADRTAEPRGLRFTSFTRNRLEALDRQGRSWSDLPLEDRICIVAMAIGYYVQPTANAAQHVITYGYEMLCRTDRLTADVPALAA